MIVEQRKYKGSDNIALQFEIHTYEYTLTYWECVVSVDIIYTVYVYVRKYYLVPLVWYGRVWKQQLLFTPDISCRDLLSIELFLTLSYQLFPNTILLGSQFFFFFLLSSSYPFPDLSEFHAVKHAFWTSLHACLLTNIYNCVISDFLSPIIFTFSLSDMRSFSA